MQSQDTKFKALFSLGGQKMTKESFLGIRNAFPWMIKNFGDFEHRGACTCFFLFLSTVVCIQCNLTEKYFQSSVNLFCREDATRCVLILSDPLWRLLFKIRSELLSGVGSRFVFNVTNPLDWQS